MHPTATFDADLVRRYDVMGPRYTSYPTALQFDDSYGAADYRRAATRSNRQPQPLSVYVHIPFCTSPCFYCGCTRIITRDPLKGKLYLDRLMREIELQAELFLPDRKVDQLHFGGGSPTFLAVDDIARLMQHLDRHFSLLHGETREFSIEIDPRTVGEQSVAQLATLGFNRISIGVQDFDERVQQAVNRVQSEEETFAVIDSARRAGVRSINVDLIYGLPFQNAKGFATTLDTILGARPERFAVYSYAHLPRMFKAQRHIEDEALPDAATKLELLELSIAKLTDAGYVYIGMDHFALPGDELVVAQRNGQLQRNFQGYSTRADCDMIGLGMSAIGKVADTYSQNTKDIAAYYAALDQGTLPIVRGIALSAEDKLRRGVIQRIMCQGEVTFGDFGFHDKSDFLRHFSSAETELQRLETDGLIEIDERRLEVKPAGRLLLRVVAMAFDAYLPQTANTSARYSRVV
ncbi:MAG TPA: oxygen-independent coproporphyrinogen III oxidase [Woeseiaceae bacterium]